MRARLTAPNSVFTYLFCVCVASCIACLGQEYTITTVAGGGSQANGKADGGPATKAWLNSPSAVAVDSAGNIYIADTGNVSLRKVGRDGIISTIAGGARATSSAEGGPAVTARLGGITGVAVDEAGNVYIADAARIRRLAPNGTITTFAGGGRCLDPGYGDGGPATRAYLYKAQSVTLDASGNLYISDSSNSQLRKVSAAGIISTVAGIATCRPGQAEGFFGDGGPATQAKLLYPQGAAADLAGNVYIADWGNGRVRKVDSNGVITTIAGSGQPGSMGFRRTLSMAAGKAPTETGIRPQSVVVDQGGNVFIADPDDSCVWMLSPDEKMRVIAGDPLSNTLGDGGPATKAILNPVGLALGKNGTIYVADAFHGRIRLLTPDRPPLEITRLDQAPAGVRPTRADEVSTVTAPSPADRSLSVDQLASRVAAAISSNAQQYKNLLYKWELRAQFTGRAASPFPTFGGDVGEKVNSRMPVFHGHIQLVDDKPASIQDGWEDQPPYRERDLKRRTILPTPGEPKTVDLIQVLLTMPHRVRLIGIASDRGSRAYMVESLPPPPAIASSLTGVARCAAAMTATVFIDAATFFPIRFDAQVVSPSMCSPGGTFVLDDVGAKEQVHFTKVARKDPCGSTREVWVIDEAVQYSRILRDGYIAFPGQFGQRIWPLGPNYRGGEFKSTTKNSDFEVFVTGACLRFGEVVESTPVESVHSDIHFDLDDVPFRDASAASVGRKQ